MKKLIVLCALFFATSAAAQESFLQVPLDSTGKKLRMRSNTVGSNLVYTQGFFLEDGSGGGPLGISTNPIFINFASGAVHAVTQSGAWSMTVSNFPATQAITATALPLPTGAATETGNLATIVANTGHIPTSPATDRSTAAAPFSMRLSDGAAFYKATTPSDTQPISAASLPLPSGAATEAGNLATIVTNTGHIPSSPATDRSTAAAPFSMRLSDGAAFYKSTTPSDTQPISNANLDAALSTLATQSTLALIKAKTDNIDVAISTRTKPADQQHTIVDSGSLSDQHSNKTADFDTSAGIDTVTVYGFALPKSGGAVVGGTSTDPIRTDPTGTTGQPITNANLDAALSTLATQSTLALIKTKTDNIDVAISTRTKPADQQHTIIDSGLPSTYPPAAAAALADTTSNPTTPSTGTFIHLFNGTTWDRARGDTTNGLWVNVKSSVGLDVTDRTARVLGHAILDAGSSAIGSITNSFLLDATYTGRMPAGASPADNESNTNTSLSRVGTFSFLFDGTTWDRWPGDSTNGGKFNLVAIAGNAILTGNGTTGSGSSRVTIASDNTPFAIKTDQTTHGTTDLVADDITKIGGTAVVNGGVAGSIASGGVGANNAAITQNPDLIGIEAQSGQPTAATTGNKRQAIGSLDGAIYVRPNGPVLWSCGLTAIAATLTQCQAAPAAGLKLYITDIQVGSNTATGGQFLVRYGTGSNCGTGTTSLYPNIAAQTTGVMPYPPNTVSPANINFTSPPAAVAANAVCVICVATNTCVINMAGYTAP